MRRFEIGSLRKVSSILSETRVKVIIVARPQLMPVVQKLGDRGGSHKQNACLFLEFASHRNNLLLSVNHSAMTSVEQYFGTKEIPGENR